MIRIAVVGLGKIALDQHLPAIGATPEINIVAVASHQGSLPGVPSFDTLDDLLASDVEIDAVSLCTPPQVRRGLAATALLSGKHVLLEKPPCATISEVNHLKTMASERQLSLFATWHSRYASAVETLRAILQSRQIISVKIDWREDVRVWHPGQNWIFDAGGLGVFDPGINALSILTRIMGEPLFVRSAILDFPSNRQAPIAATVEFTNERGIPIVAHFDFLHPGSQEWTIRAETNDGECILTSGGAKLSMSGRAIVDEPESEYRQIYRHFVKLVEKRESDADISPLALVADAFLVGRRRSVAPFDW